MSMIASRPALSAFVESEWRSQLNAISQEANRGCLSLEQYSARFLIRLNTALAEMPAAHRERAMHIARSGWH